MPQAVDPAVSIRRFGTGLIHHSAKGPQYTALVFGRRCHEAGISPSTGYAGSCYGNAAAESFFASLEPELLRRADVPNRADAGE